MATARLKQAKPKRQPHLTDIDVKMIVVAIDALEKAQAVTWDDIIKIARKAKSHTYSRQALSRHDAIKTAYDDAVKRFRVLRDGDDNVSPRQKTEAEVIVARQALKIAALQATISAYDERFIRYVENAGRFNVSVETLDLELVPLPKGQTDTGIRTKKAKVVRR